MTYHFYFFKWLLLVWTFRIYMVFILSLSSVFLYCWITRIFLFCSLNHSHFNINEEGPNNGSTLPLRDFNLGLIRPRFQVLYTHLLAAFSFLWVDRIWQNFAFCMCRDIWTEFNTNKIYIFLFKSKILKSEKYHFLSFISKCLFIWMKINKSNSKSYTKL